MRPLIKRLKDRAWLVFSAWIRNRDKRCFTCGSTKNLQAGHFFHNILDFDEENIHTQCAYCNHYLSGNLAIYAVKLLELLGQKKFEALNLRHYQAMKSEKKDEQYYQDIIDKYKLPTRLTAGH